MDHDRDHLVEVLYNANAARFIAREEALQELIPALIALGEWDEADRELPIDALEKRLDRTLGHPSRRLAVHGALRPESAALLVGLPIERRTGFVRGELVARAADGIVLGPDPAEDAVPRIVEVLESNALASLWPALDHMEGVGCIRLLVIVERDGALEVANLYSPERPPVQEP